MPEVQGCEDTDLPMSACEACWDAAFVRSRMLGGHQVEHYHVLLEERSHGLDATEGHVYVSKSDSAGGSS